MPQGQLAQPAPTDGLTTHQRRQLPTTVVFTGDGKGKSTAAFGMALRAWTAGIPLAVFQFVKSPPVDSRRGERFPRTRSTPR